jgi:teichuronic acid exporter
MSPAVASIHLPGLRGRTLRGFMLIASQRVLGLLITAGGGIVLARLLSPGIFGYYAVISFAVGLGVIFGDMGLGAALVQRQDLDIKGALETAFTLHLGFALTLGALIACLASPIAAKLGLAADATTPLRILALLIPLSAFRMPSTVLLERNLAYAPLSLADTLDTVIFHCAAIAAALSGAGVWSFVLGAITARITGLITLWVAARWRPRLRWSWTGLASTLRFGVLFQGNAVITVVRDALVPTYVAAWAGVSAVGLLNLATSLAFLPLQLISVAGRVLFPALSMLQQNPAEFAAATEKALNRMASILYPAACFLLVGADPIVRLIYGDQWVPAVPALQFFCVTSILGGTSNLLVHALYSLGRADIVLRLNLLWTVLLWILSLIFVPRLGLVGFAIASASASPFYFLTPLVLRRFAPIRFFAVVRVPMAAALVMVLPLVALNISDVQGKVSLFLLACLAAGTYLALVCLMSGRAWRSEVLTDCRKMFRLIP